MRFLNRINKVPNLALRFKMLTSALGLLIGCGLWSPTNAQTTNVGPYCSVSDDCTFNTIFNFEMVGPTFSFKNNSGICDNDGSTTWFNNLAPIKVLPGNTYTVTVRLDGGDYFNIWVDLNQDGAFQASENLLDGPQAGGFGATNVTETITIPANAKGGQTRLRLMSSDGVNLGPGDACDIPAFGNDGEVEDYTINILDIKNGKDDIAVTRIVEPQTGRSDYGAEDLKVSVLNLSDQDIPANTTIPFNIETSIGGTDQRTVTLNDPIAKIGGSDTLDLGKISLGCPGLNNIKVANSWSSDVNPNNDTTSKLYRVAGSSSAPVVFEDFESGSAGAGWTVSGGTVNGNDGPRGNFHFSGFGRGANFVEFEIDLNNLNFPVLSFWTKDINAPEVENDDGFFISNDGGSTYTRITDLDIGNNNGYTKKNFTILDVLRNNGISIPANGKIIIRLSQDDSLTSEGVAYDDILIRDFSIAKSKPSPSVILFPKPDTVFVNSPIDFNSVAEPEGNVWFRNGRQVQDGDPLYTTTFTQTGKSGVKLITAGCFGLDTASTQFQVVKPNRKPEVNFVADKFVVDTNDVVAFKDLSDYGPTKWEWIINPRRVNGDTAYRFSNSERTDRKPDVRFLESGQYDITLVAENNVGADTLTRTAYITVGDGYKICEDQQTKAAKGILYDPAGKAAFEDTGNQVCQFVIDPDCTDSLVGRFLSFNVAGDPAQQGGIPDNIKVYDGRTTNAPAIHKRLGFPSGFYKGNMPAGDLEVVARSGAMTVVLNTNGDDSKEDFALSWNAYQSPSSMVKQNAQKVSLKGPDTAFSTGVTQFSVSNPVKGASYKWIFPNVNSEVTMDTTNGILGRGVEEGTQMVKVVTRICGFADTATKQVYFKEPTQPAQADFTASRRTLNNGDTIQLIDQSGNGPNSWQWTIIPDSVEFVNNTDSASQNPFITITEPGLYRVELIARNNIGGTVEDRLKYLTVKANVNTNICEPSAANNNPDLGINEFFISRVGKNMSFSNASGYGSNGFSDFKGRPVIQVEAGMSYVIEIRRNTSFNDFSAGLWLNGNADSEFTNQEQLFSRASISGNVVRDTITIPKDIDEAGTKTLRVATNVAGGNLAGCGPHQFGEFEDYTVDFVGDQTSPQISLKGNDTVNVDICNVAAADTGATATDIVDGNLTGRVQLLNSELLEVPGTHNLQYTVRDSAGNRASVNQVVNVTPDTTDPQVTLKGPSPVDVPVGGEFIDPGVTTNDACGAVDTVLIDGEVDEEFVGDYPLTYVAVDNAGNNDTATRIVNVFDSIPPKAKLVGSDTVRVAVFGDYEELGVNASDNFLDSTFTVINGNVNTDEVGVYNLTYEVFDLDSNMVTLERVVIVEDRQAPTYNNVPEDAVVIEVNSELNPEFTPEDNFYDQSELSLNRNGDFFRNFPDGFADSIGTYNARFTYTDGSGNTSTAAFGVEVVDREAPELTLTPNVVNLGRYQRFDDSLNGTYEVSDNFYADTAITINRSGNYFSDYVNDGFPKGVYDLRYVAVDPSGNRSEVKVRGINVKTTGVEDQLGKGSVKLYPNPTSGPLNIEFEDLGNEPLKVEIINAKGQTVRKIEKGINGVQGSITLNLGNEADGLYKVRIQTAETVVTESVVVQ